MHTTVEIAYVLPNLRISGGAAIVLRHVYELRKRGRNAAVFVQDFSDDGSWHYLIKDVPVFPFDKYHGICGSSGAQHLVATWWMTAFDVAKAQAGTRHYFLQSLENRFYPRDHILHSTFFLSLLLNLNIFTEANWIRRWLLDHVHIDAPVVKNGIDLSVFYPATDKRNATDRLRVLIEGPPDKPFKGVADCFRAVHELDVEVWYVASQGEPDAAWRVNRFFKKVPFEKMRDIYAECDVLLKMSRVEGFFGPPLEMMACGGTCIVTDVTGYDEYCEHEKNCLVVPQESPDEARHAVVRLLNDRELLQALKENGLRTAQEHAWESSIDILHERIFSDRKAQSCSYGQDIIESLIAVKEYITPTVMQAPSRDGFGGKIFRAVRSLLEGK